MEAKRGYVDPFVFPKGYKGLRPRLRFNLGTKIYVPEEQDKAINKL